jgi:hypothetical protein
MQLGHGCSFDLHQHPFALPCGCEERLSNLPVLLAGGALGGEDGEHVRFYVIEHRQRVLLPVGSYTGRFFDMPSVPADDLLHFRTHRSSLMAWLLPAHTWINALLPHPIRPTQHGANFTP